MRANTSSRFILGGLLSAWLISAMSSAENLVVRNTIVAPDLLTTTLVYLTLYGWMIAIIGFVLALALGKRIDQEFTRRSLWNNLSLHACIAGIMSSLGGIFVLLAQQQTDPSAIVPLFATTLLYTAEHDLRSGKIGFSQIAMPLAATILGSALAAFNGSFVVTGTTLLLVVGFSNFCSARTDIAIQKGARRNNAVATFAWSLFWYAVVNSILAIVFLRMQLDTDAIVTTFEDSANALPWMMLTAGVAFLGIAIKATLLKNNAVSVVLVVLSAQVVFTHPITIFGELVQPGIFGGLPDLSVWCVRIVGAIVLIWGISSIRRTI